MHSSIATHKLGSGHAWLEQLSRSLLPLIGWRVEGRELLTGPKYVLVVAHHTSNWDALIGLICAHAIGLFQDWRCGYMIKASATRWPLIGRLLLWLGGIPIEREAAQDVVAQAVAVFQRSERLILAITPEGTRRRRAYWKTGFYRIALAAQVPMALGYLDYRHRRAGIGRIVVPSGDLETDFEALRQFYSTVTAKIPGDVGEIRARPDAAG